MAERIFTALDRCDRCNAQACRRTFHTWTNPNGTSGMGALLWCEHHYRTTGLEAS